MDNYDFLWENKYFEEGNGQDEIGWDERQSWTRDYMTALSFYPNPTDLNLCLNPTLKSNSNCTGWHANLSRLF